MQEIAAEEKVKPVAQEAYFNFFYFKSDTLNLSAFIYLFITCFFYRFAEFVICICMHVHRQVNQFLFHQQNNIFHLF